jgi:hypothetical protein
MVAAIRQTVTVGPGGHVEIRSPELEEGQRADVIVLVGDRSSSASRLAALDQLQQSLNLTDTTAQQWIQQARRERESLERGR